MGKRKIRSVETTSYKVRVGDDGRWHYQGDSLVQAVDVVTTLSWTGMGKGELTTLVDGRPIRKTIYRDGQPTKTIAY